MDAEYRWCNIFGILKLKNIVFIYNRLYDLKQIKASNTFYCVVLNIYYYLLVRYKQFPYNV